jgi:hypothetical protein
LSLELGGTYYFGGAAFSQTYGSHAGSESSGLGFGNLYSVNCGIGLNYFFKKMHLSVRPNYNYFLNWNEYDWSPTERNYYKLNLYSYGLEIGLNYQLGKT